MGNSKDQFLIQVRDLKKYFYRQQLFSSEKKPIRAVDGISFSIRKGETLGLVGESGCGKTTAGKSILRLIEPTSGQIFFKGQEILQLDREAMRKLRPHMQFIFQDPYESLNPRMKVGEIVGEGLEVHRVAQGKENARRVSDLLERVGLHPQDALRYPHEFSGGQRQRIGIARALALNPKLIIGDEPVSALDVSIQAQVINLLEDVQEEFKLSYIIIAHDLAVVEHVCDRIAVMYLGRIAELAKDRELYASPLHPYTVALLSAIPVPDPNITKKRMILEGDIPSPINPPSGCHFHTRCPRKMEVCQATIPELKEIKEDHFVACHLHN